MVPRILFIAVAAAIAAAGCDKKPEQGTATHCRGDECQVKLTVVNGVPKPDIDPVPVAEGNHGAGGNGVILHWHVEGDYSFRDDGIQPKGDSVEGWPRQFDQPGTGGSGKEFHWRDKNTDTTKYTYKITVYDKDGVPHASDPAVQNGAH
jgi:hypothetical protein